MILLARFLGAEEFGVFAFALSIFTVLSIVAELGLPIVVTRFATIYFLKKQIKLFKGIINFSNSRIILMSCLLMVVTIILYFLNTFTGEYDKVILYGLPLIILFSLSRLRSAILMAVHKVNIAQLPEMIVRPLLIIVFVSLLYYFGNISASNAILLYVAINIIVYLMGEFLVKKYTREFLVRKNNLNFEKNKWIAAALPLFFLGGIQILGAHSDIFFLGIMAESKDVGVFKSMYQISLLVLFSLSAVNAISTPLIVNDFEQNNFRGLRKTFLNFCGINFVFSLLIGSLLLFLGKYFIELLYGKEYLVGYSCLQILIIGRIINATLGASNQFLKMMGEEKKATKGIITGVIVGIILNIILIPDYGIVGSSIAVAISLTTWNVYLFIILMRKIGFNQ